MIFKNFQKYEDLKSEWKIWREKEREEGKEKRGEEVYKVH